MNAPCTTLDWDRLLAYRLGELTVGDEEAVESHLFGCEDCARRMEALEHLRSGVRSLVQAGRISGAVTSDFLHWAERHGLQLRKYRLAPGEQVACTAAPEDDFVVVQLELPVSRPERVDVRLQGRMLATGEPTLDRLEDVVVDARTQEVVLILSGDRIRALPRSQWDYRLSVRSEGAEHAVGPYLLDHTPWEERAALDTPER